MRMGTRAHQRSRARACTAERAPAWVWWVAALLLGAALAPSVRAQSEPPRAVPNTAPPNAAPQAPPLVPEVVRPGAPTTPPGAGGDTTTVQPQRDSIVPPGGTVAPVPDRGIVAPTPITPGVVAPPSAGQTPVIAPPGGSAMPVIPPSGAAK